MRRGCVCVPIMRIFRREDEDVVYKKDEYETINVNQAIIIFN